MTELLMVEKISSVCWLVSDKLLDCVNESMRGINGLSPNQVIFRVLLAVSYSDDFLEQKWIKYISNNLFREVDTAVLEKTLVALSLLIPCTHYTKGPGWYIPKELKSAVNKLFRCNWGVMGKFFDLAARLEELASPSQADSQLYGTPQLSRTPAPSILDRGGISCPSTPHSLEDQKKRISFLLPDNLVVLTESQQVYYRDILMSQPVI